VWNETTSAWIKTALAATALAVVVVHEWARRTRPAERPSSGAAARTRALQVLGALSLLAYFNFGSFHFDGIFVHLWDSAHYVLGAKYFDELGYDGIYECIAVADAEAPGETSRVAAREMLDLRTGRMTTAAESVAHPERCRSRFSSSRWADFTRDVGFFRERFPPADWDRLATDHGFNASPAWILIAHPLVGNSPLTWGKVKALAMIDPLLLVGAFAALLWAFGGWTAALAAVVLGTYFPARLWWTGGSFLRWDWLAMLLAGLALCRRERPFIGGALLGYAAMVRIFPGFALIGAALGAATALATRKPLAAGVGRLLAGALCASVILAVLPAIAGRDRAWLDFAARLEDHASVPSPNRMGLAVVLASRPSVERAGSTTHDGLTPRARWEEAEATVLRRRRGWWIAALLAGAVGIAAATRGEPAWATCVLGLLLVPLGTPIACYYYAFVAAVPLLAQRRTEVGALALALTLAASLVSRLEHYPDDRQYFAQSLLVVSVFVFIASAFSSRSPSESSPASIS
jgi:hypothetical protein